MRRRLRRGNGEPFEDDSSNPMAGVSNLADAMLVLAVGIMLALIMNWHVSISGGYTTQLDQSNMTEIEDDELQEAENDQEGGTEYEEKGTVYIDKKTGDMYLVESDEEN